MQVAKTFSTFNCYHLYTQISQPWWKFMEGSELVVLFLITLKMSDFLIISIFP